MYEPDIFQTTRRFGTVLENVDLDPRTRALDLDSERITENTRGAYPLEFIGNADETGIAGRPRTVVFLTADAFGVLPPISRLTHEQAAYHFISGYTAKLAGTEIGVKEPKATFSACFGAPFMPRHPGRVRGDAGRAPGARRCPGLAGQHRLDRRAVRRRRADEHRPHPRDGPSRPRRRARRRADPDRSELRRSRSRPAVRTCPPRSSTRGRRGPTRMPTTGRRPISTRCSATTSPATPTGWTRRSRSAGPRPAD